jgi:ornithine cyclodeaminase/alanine dehydrogenase-like protein (mu-crystallin family)
VQVPFIDGEELSRRLPMPLAIDALEAAFRDGDPSAAPLRSHVQTPEGTLLLMPAVGEPGVGVKIVTLTEGTPVSGLATRHLARREAGRLVLFGAGVQARAHLEAMAAVRSVTDLVVVSRTQERAEALVAVASAMGVEAAVGGPEAVSQADLVCTCTTATEPLFPGSALLRGAHVNAVGAYQPHAREVDTETVRRARVVVETRAAAMEEAGDLLIPIGEGAITADHIEADLGEVVRGQHVRDGEADITLFESVGLAFEDLAVAGALAATM